MTKVGARILGLTFDGRPIWEPANAGSSICYAAAGGGKTTCVAIPAVQSLLSDHSRAMFVNDVKNGEVAAQIGPMCLKHGRKFGVLDDFGVMGANYPHRISLNAFGSAVAALNAGVSHLPFIIENMSHALIDEPKDDHKNFYWRESPRAGFIELGINLLLDGHRRLAFPGGLHALLADPLLWDRALKGALGSLDTTLAASARQVLEMREQNPEHYAQHLRSALTSLKIFSFGPLANAGRAPDVTHAELIRDKWIVCFVNPARYAERLGPYFALHFLALMDAQLSGGAGKADYILDEFCNAPLRDALNRVTIQRAFSARSHFITQSRQDIVRKYGEKETALLEENCTIKQYLKFSNFEEAERLSRAMGETLNIQRGLGLASDKQSFTGNYSTGRERLFSAEALMRLPGDEQILHIADVGFIHCKKIRQNQIAPYCYELGANPLEGGTLTPDPKVTLATGHRP
ncbi:type IV secretory system conjugative DNA transfer family protein [Mesorhizobium sp. J428]|uniref:type IV secretory system conjugative DNA transfer family protein n=1 Tax=Mesorhizobium sp. J428 TaxID=2898440 RepID=UPI002150852D|nr:type IV secretory system conjugative DNA transfer family protein [Mesorhizobium sp. J428]MCR5858265.1 type IV secretory system conjugative DNA transfer family protein [Mesorhizobium sp. J428]